jgi:acyl-CoA thioester hydrolase
LIVARFEIDYKIPLLVDDRPIIYTQCVRLGKKSFELAWAMTTEQEHSECLAATGKTVIVCFDYASKHPIDIPADKRAALESFDLIE